LGHNGIHIGAVFALGRQQNRELGFEFVRSGIEEYGHFSLRQLPFP
jgi:hypothetical protein